MFLTSSAQTEQFWLPLIPIMSHPSNWKITQVCSLKSCMPFITLQDMVLAASCHPKDERFGVCSTVYGKCQRENTFFHLCCGLLHWLRMSRMWNIFSESSMKFQAYGSQRYSVIGVKYSSKSNTVAVDLSLLAFKGTVLTDNSVEPLQTSSFSMTCNFLSHNDLTTYFHSEFSNPHAKIKAQCFTFHPGRIHVEAHL